MVIKCVCYNKTFSELLVLAKKYNWTTTQIVENTRCGTACGLCVPYIEECLKTEKTEFDYLRFNALRKQ
jgi:hypothetical protein